jgi:hypothetical protein
MPGAPRLCWRLRGAQPAGGAGLPGARGWLAHARCCPAPPLPPPTPPRTRTHARAHTAWPSAQIAAAYGYDEINLNCGCPSDRVAGAGCFGAAMMLQPELVAACMKAMGEAAGGTEVNVKCRWAARARPCLPYPAQVRGRGLRLAPASISASWGGGVWGGGGRGGWWGQPS